MEETAKVLTFGAKKYSEDNWRQVEGLQKRYLAAAMRHINAIQKGERLDPESGLHHLAHVMCCISFMLEDQLAPPAPMRDHDSNRGTKNILGAVRSIAKCATTDDGSPNSRSGMAGRWIWDPTAIEIPEGALKAHEAETKLENEEIKD
jgi:hypothetical protein